MAKNDNAGNARPVSDNKSEAKPNPAEETIAESKLGGIGIEGKTPAETRARLLAINEAHLANAGSAKAGIEKAQGEYEKILKTMSADALSQFARLKQQNMTKALSDPAAYFDDIINNYRTDGGFSADGWDRIRWAAEANAFVGRDKPAMGEFATNKPARIKLKGKTRDETEQNLLDYNDAYLASQGFSVSDRKEERDFYEKELKGFSDERINKIAADKEARFAQAVTPRKNEEKSIITSALIDPDVTTAHAFLAQSKPAPVTMPMGKPPAKNER